MDNLKPLDGSPSLAGDKRAPSLKSPFTWQIELGQASSTALLQVCWAVVIAKYANAADVRFRYVSELPSSPGKLQQFCFRVVPNQDLDAALTAASHYDATIQHEQDSTTHQELVDGCVDEIHSQTLLVIRKGMSLMDDESYRAAYGVRGLVVICMSDAQHATVKASFDDDVTSPLYVYMMVSQFGQALRIASQCRRGRVSIDDLLEISPEGLRQIAEWNQDRTYEKKGAYIHRLFEKRVDKHPHAPAICAWDGELTYCELNAHAAAVASRILEAALPGDEGILGLFFEKSMWTTVAILGALKAGKGFILLHPSQPVKRLQAICNRLGVQAVLSLPQFEASVEALGAPKILLSGRTDQPCTQNPAREEAKGTPQYDRVLYAGFTSGSTGEPKIYTISHAAFCSGLDAWGRALNVNERSRVFQSASYNFTVSTIEQLAPLCLGGCVCVPSEEALRNDIGAAIRTLRSNWAEFTPGVARLLNPEAVPEVRTLLLTGEAVTKADVDRWHGRLDLRVFYGQSENSMGASVAIYEDLASDHRNIGRTFASRGWLVDPDNHHRLVPLGVEGELLLEGPCVGPGYLNNPEQTNATFIHNPAWLQKHQLTPIAGGRFLKTGDLVCYDLRRGCFQYRGRKGVQVKIRGQRVELGEIEYHASQHLSSYDGAPVAEVVRPADSPRDLDPMLVLFIASRPTSNIDAVPKDKATVPTVLPPNDRFRMKAKAALARLSEILPSYMVPLAVIPVSHTPQTPTGKLSRRMLRDTASRLARNEIMAYGSWRKPHLPPRNPPEETLQRLCAAVLRCPPKQVGMQDTFLELGGDSLTVRHLVQAARVEGLNLRAEDVFTHLTLADLAQRCQESPSCATSQPSAAVDERTSSVVQKFFLDYPNFAIWAHVESVSLTHDIVTAVGNKDAVEHFLFTLSGPLDLERLKAACQALVASHAVLRSLFIPYEEEIMQVTLRQLQAPYSVVQAPRGVDLGAFASTICGKDERHSPFGPQPVTAFTVVEASRDSHVLILRVCEAQCDAQGLKTTISQLMHLYDGEPFQVSLDYREYLDICAKLRTPAAFSFWRNLLLGSSPLYLDGLCPGATQLGKDYCRDRPPSISYSRTVPHVCPPSGITLATTIKAAWSYMLHQKGGRDDIVFGQLRSCRTMNVPGIEDVVGPCTNVTPVRVTYSPTWHVREVLQAIQEQHAQSIPFETIGWRDIVTHCTEWPSTASLQTVVLHQGEEQATDILARDGVRCRDLDWNASTILGRLYLITTVTSSGIKVELCVSRAAIESRDAEGLLDLFGDALNKFTS
ncbi:acetyl-CoA synthetase-like protein [Aspergillus terreus]|uniref:Acetyl-CoA synthetase-like protein n=1 Tax=Aspergillus terreus TaxID=33178 RepID=A0A5M3Z0F4_ASPTE|nr:hypothetical protein ATETN484_0005005000 [Aspergillus terreus]GFF16717.1 acetyl-CoA synthetase-like protein [Aspergillus terreus]